MEKELSEPVDMCRADGKLNPAAVGWSRYPQHHANLRGWGRNKRFDYWCVTSPELILAFSVSDIDYRSGASVFMLDRERQVPIVAGKADWAKANPTMRAPWGSCPIVTKGNGIDITVDPTGRDISVQVDTEQVGAEFTVTVPRDHESMGVLVPWSNRLFQYTRKDNCLATSGQVQAGGRNFTLNEDDVTATMDHGRGRWPYNTVWNWACAGGWSNGHEIGLQFGGKWTVGTPSTENSLRIDGRVEKISEELNWSYRDDSWLSPWRITGSRVDVTMYPEYHRHSRFDKRVLLSREDQVFGTFYGRVTSEAGHTLDVDGLFGWAEEVHRRW